MSSVTVVGLGEMGAALAGAFVRSGDRVTVWNRSADKAEPMIRAGASLAPSVAEAVRASEITVICLSDYPATREVLASEGVDSVLSNRMIVQLSTGTPREARDLEIWMQARGAQYLDGAILAWPRQIGTPEASIVVSGREGSYQLHELQLRKLAGNVTFLSDDAGKSAALFSAMLSYLAGHWIGLCHGARVCEVEGVSVTAFGSMLADLTPLLGVEAKHLSEVIENNDYADPESTIKTAGTDVIRLVQHARESGINAEFPTFAAGLFQRAIDAGYGAEEHAALIKVLR
jgi:3-hydroxyisobutyrate dehydrogenase-like beta-hydroxyacid dehydrogenase